MANSKLVPEYILEIRESGTKKGQNPAFINFIGATVAASGNGLNVTISGGGGPESDPVFGAWLAAVPDLSEFNNDVGYLTAMGALDDLSDVTVSAPTTGQVLKYNGSAWVNDTDAGSAPDFGCCTQIPFMQADHTNFDYAASFTYDSTALLLSTWACTTADWQYDCRIQRSGVLDTYYRGNGSCCLDSIFQFGFFDGEAAYWGLNSCPIANSHMVNQYLRFTDYCTKWGNDDAYWEISDTNNGITGRFMCDFSLANSSSSWAIGYCSANPNNILINNAYYLPSSAPADSNCVMRLNTGTGLLEWCSFPTGSGSPYGSQYEIQLNDGAGSFYATCNFLYDYSSYFMQMRHNGTAELLRFSNSNCADFGWLVDVTNDTCGQGCNLTFRVGDDGMSTPSRVRMDDYCCSENWIDFNPRLHMMRFHYNDGMTYNFNSEFGYDASNSATVMRNCCFGKFEIGECNIDRMKWTFATYNDYIKAEDCIVSYGGCCNFQWKFNNGCSNGWNEWLSSGPALGLVISSDDGCCLCPLVLAQGLVKRAEFDTSGMFVVSADTNLNGTNLCVLGNATFTGTFDTATNTQITIVNGIITGIA